MVKNPEKKKSFASYNNIDVLLKRKPHALDRFNN